MGTFIILESELTHYLDLLCTAPPADTDPLYGQMVVGEEGDAWAVAPPQCAAGPAGHSGLEKLALCMQYSWFLPHLSNRVVERPSKFMLSFGDYLCQLLLCQKQFFKMLHLCPKCPAYVCLSESALLFLSLLLALHLRHITETYSVLTLKTGDF